MSSLFLQKATRDLQENHERRMKASGSIDTAAVVFENLAEGFSGHVTFKKDETGKLYLHKCMSDAALEIQRKEDLEKTAALMELAHNHGVVHGGKLKGEKAKRKKLEKRIVKLEQVLTESEKEHKFLKQQLDEQMNEIRRLHQEAHVSKEEAASAIANYGAMKAEYERMDKMLEETRNELGALKHGSSDGSEAASSSSSTSEGKDAIAAFLAQQDDAKNNK